MTSVAQRLREKEVESTQGEQDEDEEVKKEVTQDEIFTIVQQYRKGQVKAKERRERAGFVVMAITAVETARMTSRTTAGQMVEHGRIRKAGRQAHIQAKDGTQAGAIGTVEAAHGKSQEWQGQTNRLERVSVERQEQSVDEASDNDCWHSQTDHSQKKKFTSAC